MKVEIELWNEYKQRVSKDKKKQEFFDQQYEDYLKLVKGGCEFYKKFQKELNDLPLGVALRSWMASLANKKDARKKFEDLLVLFDSKISFLKDKGRLITLGNLAERERSKECKIIDLIREVFDWSLEKRERLVSAYKEFGVYLNRETRGVIQKPIDHDREAVSHKILDFDVFIKFLRGLSERDALQAQLLYFGAPSVEEVVQLKYNMINKIKKAVHFSSCFVVYPQHLIVSVLNYSKGRLKDDFIFLSYKGTPIDRTHLNQSFARASKKVLNDQKITPRNLLETKTFIR